MGVQVEPEYATKHYDVPLTALKADKSQYQSFSNVFVCALCEPLEQKIDRLRPFNLS
jgi:hypothetical protein